MKDFRETYTIWSCALTKIRYTVKYTFNNIAIPIVGKPLQLKIMSVVFV